MKKARNNKTKLAIIAACCLTLGLVFSVPVKAQSPVNGTSTGGNYGTVTTASHTFNSAHGSFTATHKTGAYISAPTCSITVTGYNGNGVGIVCDVASGTLSCSKTVYASGIYSATCHSCFCGVDYWMASN